MAPSALSSTLRSAAGAVLLALLGLAPAAAASESLPAPVRIPGIEAGREVLADSPAPQAVLDGWVYFPATDPRHGRELWRSDGTNRELVADLCPGRCSSSPDNLAALGGRLFFSADDGVTGREPWQSDGTAAGTGRLADICFGRCPSLPAPGAAFPFAPAALDGEVFFAAANNFGIDLWKTDGTPQGTVAVTATYRSAGPSLEPRGFVAFGDTLYFSGNDALHGRELWASDGTRAGTRLVRDFCAGACSSNVEILAAAGERLLLAATTAVDGSRTPWTLDSAGAVAPFGDFCAAGCRRIAAAPWQGELAVATEEPAGSRLWRTDLEPGGSSVLGELYAVENLTPSGAQLFFTADDTVSGEELWVTDGTPAGTRLVRDLASGAGSSAPLALTPFAGGVVFQAFTDQGREPWVSDGTAAGTWLLGDLDPGREWGPHGSSRPASFVVLADRVLFAAESSSNRELWRSDGTAAGTVKLSSPAAVGSNPADLTAWGERLAFAATEQSKGREPWLARGTGAAFLADINGSYEGGSDPHGFIPFAGRLYFVAQGPYDSLDRMWVSDGTAAGTAVLPGMYRLTSRPVAAGANLLFLAEPFPCSEDCSEPYRLRPGDLRPGVVRDINPGLIVQDPDRPDFGQYAGSHGHDLTTLGERLFFGADDGTTGDEPWVSDGSLAGTVQVADLCPGSCSSHPQGFVSLGGQVLVATAGSGVDKGALWRLDGAGAVQLHAFTLTLRPGGPRDLAVVAGRAFFLVAERGGDELWTSDGSAAGTVRISDLRTAGGPALARQLIVAGPRLFFTAFHPDTGEEEFWVSDGTADGTRQVADLWPGPDSSGPRGLTAIDGRLVFAAAEPATGHELWTSDGGAPVRLSNIASGTASSSPEEPTAAGDLIYFSADDGSGRSLWALPRTALGPPVCRPDATTLCLQRGRFEVRVAWRSPNAPGGSGSGQAIPRSEETGLFWFFSPTNVELLVKVLDGRSVNGRFWVFFGALTNVAYQVTVRDLATGAVHTYSNPQGTLCGQSDTGSFPSSAASSPAAPAAMVASPAPAAPAPVSAAAGACQPAADALCLQGGRFRVEVAFRNQHAGGVEGKGTALPGTDETGFFWFFGPDNVELAVKVLDARALDGHHWVLYGALTDVEYELTVTDTATGARKVYHSPPGQLCGGADAAAF